MPGETVAAELDALRAELERVRRERDALAKRILELEQQLAAPPSPAASTAPASASFEDAFRIEQSRAKRERLPLTMALVELHGLQELRDRLGHRAGEDAFFHLGLVLEGSLRPTDVVAAVDGFAYGVLLPTTGVESALAAMTRVLNNVGERPFVCGQTESALSFSAGVAQWRHDEALDDLMTRASRALGLARRAGAGRIVVG